MDENELRFFRSVSVILLLEAPTNLRSELRGVLARILQSIETNENGLVPMVVSEELRDWLVEMGLDIHSSINISNN